MPVAVSYPGVYVEELPSGVRTVSGVATSIAAFIGRSERGPDNIPVTVTSFADFERRFGGLWQPSTMSYAVRDFFANGGGRAVIVRVIRNEPAGEGEDPVELATPAELELIPGDGGAATGEIALIAASAGSWGNDLRVRIDPIPGTSDAFNLRARDMGTGAEERFLNVSIDPTAPRSLDRVLASSTLVALDGATPTTLPTVNVELAAGIDPFTSEQPNAYYEVTSDGADGDVPTDIEYEGSEADKTGLYALEDADLFNLLCIPPPLRGGDTAVPLYQSAAMYCARRRAMLLVDPPGAWVTPADAISGLAGAGISGTVARNAAIYFPRVLQADRLADGFIDSFVPCGMVAGVMARTDAQRGVWKAPAGLDASLNGIQGLEYTLTDAENGLLNPLGINCLRGFATSGRVIWGSRTLRGSDQAADEYKYIPVRRLALFIEESLFRGTQWVVFEPNDEPLWAQIRLNLGAFMNNLFRQGAFQGKSPREAYFVKCDAETTTQNDIDLGIVNVVVGFAPLKPAEFVILKLQQIAGQITA